MWPKPSAIVREAVVIMAGAMLAALIVGRMPSVKDWMRRQWS